MGVDFLLQNKIMHSTIINNIKRKKSNKTEKETTTITWSRATASAKATAADKQELILGRNVYDIFCVKL